MSEHLNIYRTALLALCALPLVALAAGESIERKVAADPHGEVVISNVSGTIEVRGWIATKCRSPAISAAASKPRSGIRGGRTVIKVCAAASWRA